MSHVEKPMKPVLAFFFDSSAISSLLFLFFHAQIRPFAVFFDLGFIGTASVLEDSRGDLAAAEALNRAPCDIRMASSACHHALGLIQAQGNSPRTGLQDKVGSFSLELVSKDMQLLSRGSHYPGSRKLHGESLWNEKNLFPRCVDVPLTQKGVEEAIEAGKRISNIPIDMIYTSSLIRAQMTSMLAMTQHRHKKWSQIYSEGTKEQSIPVITAWQLNERMYGELQGLNKQETAARFGKEKVNKWRHSYDIPPPRA
ncbi:2,3-bisphosphoglycerate-dependent phosphoglycerate [Musa troglodytarum]|uniref:phosphoglycerate mutase (2,3-diphosphoglycerate-dependent) n=1 Tax=Musa troglodytarum TaxID=320322 RepID=A0A9E7HPI1_9LILI|nr:2,3-bisphosphoglycerate-dependent phosphoglycerate [Musa troglodytarum]